MRPPALGARQEGQPAALGAQSLERLDLDAGDPPRLEPLEVVAERVLAQRRVQGRQRLLPQHGDRRVDQQQRAGHDQDHRERAQRPVGAAPPALQPYGGTHRRSADSVPPSDPGPA
jgi:hypothetical protein